MNLHPLLLSSLLLVGCASPNPEKSQWINAVAKQCFDSVVVLDQGRRATCPMSMAEWCMDLRAQCYKHAADEYKRTHPIL